jgi:hypothetical protein
MKRKEGEEVEDEEEEEGEGRGDGRLSSELEQLKADLLLN